MTETKAPKSTYTLKGPCSNCPFRNDQESYLRPDRVVEIGNALLRGEEFHCHKTVDYSTENEEGETEGRVAAKTRVCGGAMATLHREGRDTQMERITARLGLPVAETDPDAPVYDSIAEWVRAKNGTPTVSHTFLGVTEVAEMEHCGVVGPNCEDPAGYAVGGGASENLDEPQCNPFDGCGYCGSAMCTACRARDDEDGTKMCVYCAGEEE